MLAGSNFFARPIAGPPAERDWKADVDLLVAEHAQLRAVVSGFKNPTAAQAHWTRGAAAHDLYHAGQVRLLRRLCPL